MKIDWMVVALAGLLILTAVSVWRAHCNPENEINIVDLVLEHGRMSRIAVAFMLTLGVTTWLMVDLEIKGRMTEGYLWAYGSMWVAPLVAKVIFNKSEPPALAKPEGTP